MNVRTSSLLFAGVAAFVVAALAPSTLHAQGAGRAAAEGRAAGAPQPVPDVEMVTEREVFRYPAFQRRNPFRELVGEDVGPRFEQVELRGVVFNAQNPELSVALMAMRQGAAQRAIRSIETRQRQEQQGTAPISDTIYVPEMTQRVRVGMRWGNMRVVQIGRDHVVLAVTEFGITEQRTLRLQVRRPGGPS